jgi:hypothetical protein
MASKTYANWTQNEADTKKHPRREVFTRANTSFEDWKVMVAECFAKEGVDINLPSKLNFLHAWEGNITPYGFAEEWSRRVRRHTARAKMGPAGIDGGI